MKTILALLMALSLSTIICQAQAIPAVPDADTVPVTHAKIKQLIGWMHQLKDANDTYIAGTIKAQSTTVDTIAANNVLTGQIVDLNKKVDTLQGANDKLTVANKELDRLYHRLEWPLCALAGILAAAACLFIFARTGVFKSISMAGWLGPLILVGSPVLVFAITFAAVAKIL